MKLLMEMKEHCGVKKAINSELWHACAGPLVTLPQVGSLVYYFPQGHSEQVAATTNRTGTTQVPNYPNLPSQLLCQVLNATLHADKDTDEIFAQMSLQPLNSEKDVFPIPDLGMKQSRHPSEFFCKTLTPSDTSTHGGFSVPRRAAEKLFPQLDFSMQPPTQELIFRDLHDNTWTFRHIYRGQPKRHLLTTGWSMFVGAKRLKAGDAVIFIRDEKSQLLLGVRRTNRQQTASPSSILSADSMHIGVLAAAAHAVANRSPFSVFYNPRACRSEFVIPLAKYRKSVNGIQLSVGMRFGMMFETEDSGKHRYKGTITGISDLDPLRWPGSKWHNLQVEWEDSGCDGRQNRVSPWDVETPESLFIFPSLTSNLKRPFGHGYIGDQTESNNMATRPFMRAPEGVDSLWSEQLIKMLTKPQTVIGSEAGAANRPPLQEAKTSVLASSETVKSESSELTSCDDNTLFSNPEISPRNLVNEPSPPDLSLLHDPHFVTPQLDPSLLLPYSAIGEETWDPRDDVYGCLNFEGGNGKSTVVDLSVSSSGLDELCATKAGDFRNPSDFVVNDNLGSWHRVGPAPRVRTYTKIQKAGSVGRSIDVSSFKNYDELCREIERMFGLEGLLNDSICSSWKLVYVDFENDVLLVGDDPWEEFVGCVRCIRILSPCEVRQMGEEGMQLLNNSTAALHALMTAQQHTPEVA